MNRTRFTVGAVFAILLFRACLATAQTLPEKYVPQYPARYMGGDAKLVTAPNGAVIYYKALEAASALTHSDGSGTLSSLARMDGAEAVQTKGLGSALCSAR
jgi:hypothetical protein